MSTFTVRINCDNAAFCDDDGDPLPEIEVCRILRDLARDIERLGLQPRTIVYDINGNKVGTAHFEE